MKQFKTLIFIVFIYLSASPFGGNLVSAFPLGGCGPLLERLSIDGPITPASRLPLIETNAATVIPGPNHFTWYNLKYEDFQSYRGSVYDIDNYPKSQQCLSEEDFDTDEQTLIKILETRTLNKFNEPSIEVGAWRVETSTGQVFHSEITTSDAYDHITVADLTRALMDMMKKEKVAYFDIKSLQLFHTHPQWMFLSWPDDDLLGHYKDLFLSNGSAAIIHIYSTYRVPKKDGLGRGNILFHKSR